MEGEMDLCLPVCLCGGYTRLDGRVCECFRVLRSDSEAEIQFLVPTRGHPMNHLDLENGSPA